MSVRKQKKRRKKFNGTHRYIYSTKCRNPQILKHTLSSLPKRTIQQPAGEEQCKNPYISNEIIVFCTASEANNM
jgi:hypothetical protein